MTATWSSHFMTATWSSHRHISWSIMDRRHHQLESHQHQGSESSIGVIEHQHQVLDSLILALNNHGSHLSVNNWSHITLKVYIVDRAQSQHQGSSSSIQHLDQRQHQWSSSSYPTFLDRSHQCCYNINSLPATAAAQRRSNSTQKQLNAEATQRRQQQLNAAATQPSSKDNSNSKS